MEKIWAKACTVGYLIRICVLGKTKDHEDQSAKISYDDSPCEQRQHSKTFICCAPMESKDTNPFYVCIIDSLQCFTPQVNEKYRKCRIVCVCAYVRACMCVFKSTHIFNIIR